MVFAGQLRRELAAAEAFRGTGRSSRRPPAGGPGVPSGGGGGPDRSEPVAEAAEPAGAGMLPAGDGDDRQSKGVPAHPPVPVRVVPAAGGRAAAPHPGPGGPLDGRRAPGHRAPSGFHLRPVSAAPARPHRPVFGASRVREKLHPDREADGGREDPRPHGLRGFGEPADGAPLGPARGADGGDRPAPGPAARCGGAGRRGSGPRDRGISGTGPRPRVRGAVAPAAHRVSGAAPRGGAP